MEKSQVSFAACWISRLKILSLVNSLNSILKPIRDLVWVIVDYVASASTAVRPRCANNIVLVRVAAGGVKGSNEAT